MTKDKCRNKLIELYLRLYLERFDTKPLYWCWSGKGEIEFLHEHRMQHLSLMDVIFGVIGKI